MLGITYSLTFTPNTIRFGNRCYKYYHEWTTDDAWRN